MWGFERQDASPLGALLDEKLHALAGAVPQLGQDRPGKLDKWKPRLRGVAECHQPVTEFEATFGISAQQAVRLQRRGQTVNRRPREASRLLQLRQCLGAFGNRMHNGHRFVEHAHTGYDVHIQRNCIPYDGIAQD